MRYYVQYGAGLGGLVFPALSGDLGDVDVQFRDDSSVAFVTGATSDRVAELPYLKNAFQILVTAPRGAMSRSVDQIARLLRKGAALRDQRRGAPFRTMVNIDGQLVGLPRETRSRLESVIAEQTGGRLNARGGVGVEYWIVGRRDLDQLLFCRKITVGAKKAGARGSLSADLATLLVRASGPRHEDVFLDPFAGSGAIVAMRIKTPFRKAIYSDINLPELRPQLSPQIVKRRNVDILAEDALALPSVPDGSVSCIVTDPPWGEYESLDRPYEEFVASMLKSFDRVLDQNGRLVLLLSRRSARDVASVWKTADLRVTDSHDILVNGHPATVLVGGRLNV